MAGTSTYSEAFLRAVAFILPHEEEFARGHWGDENFVIPENVSGDSGGWTKYGIDASSHPGVDVKDLTRPQAIAISLPLTVDGDLGPKTLLAAQACDQAAVLQYFINERDARFESIATGARKKFLAGWKQRDTDLREFLLAA